MDYESEQLDAYEAAEAQRYVMGAVKKPEQKFELFGVGSDDLKEAGEKVQGQLQEAGRAVKTGLRTGAQGLVDAGTEFVTAGGEEFLKQSGMAYTDGSPVRLDIPSPQLPETETPQTTFGQIGSDLIQFASVFALTPNPTQKFGAVGNAINMMSRGAVADASFDPTKDYSLGMVNGLINMGALPETMQFLAADVNEESTAEEKLIGRLNLALEGGALGLGADGFLSGLKAIKNSPAAMKAVGTSIMAATGATVTAGEAQGNPLKTLYRAFTKNGIKDEGGLILNLEKAADELRLHNSRIEKAEATGTDYPGTPKNPRTVISAPAGSGLPNVVVGDIEPQDWVQRIDAAMSPEEIKEAADWYKIVFGEFKERAGGNPTEMAKLVDAWFAGQQQRSPSQTLGDVLSVYEQIQRGVPKEELVGRGLPSANKIVVDILTASEVRAGAGQKISDFLDSGYGKNVRSYMNNSPDGGSPFVVDIHTARDTGLVDPTFINHLKRLGYNVPNNLATDFGSGGIKGTMYENRAQFGHRLTQYLNDISWQGKNDWEPAEVQAIGWMQLSRMTGNTGQGGDVRTAFAQNTRRISMEADPGAGSPWAEKFGTRYSDLSDELRIDLNNQVTAKAIDMVNGEMGIKLGENVHGTGGWELFQNPSTVQQAIASRDTAVAAAARLGYYLNQTEVWINAPKTITKNPKHFAVDIIQDNGNQLREGDMLTQLFDGIIGEEPNGLFRGYQPIVIEGKPGIRILIDDTAIKQSPLSKAKAQEYILDFANNKLSDITDGLGLDVSVDVMEADLTKLRNDWTEDPSGGSYKSYFSGQSGENAESGVGVLDSNRQQLENFFGQLLDKAEGN